MAKRKTKKEKQTTQDVDEFVGTMHRIGERIKPHIVPIAVALGGLTVILISYYTYQWWQHRKERKATTALAQALEVADRRVSEFDKPDTNDPNNKQIVYKTPEERAQALLKALKKVDPSTDVGHNALLLRGGALYDLGKYDEALKAYRAVASGSAPDAVKRVAREGVGLVLEAQAEKAKSNDGFQQALDAYRKIQSDEKGPGRDLALFHEGRILARLGKQKDAIAAFEKLTQLKPPSMFTPDAERRLAVLRTKDTYPKPKPKKTIKPEDTPDDDHGDDDKKPADGAKKPANDNKKPANDTKPAGTKKPADPKPAGTKKPAGKKTP